MSAKQAMVEMDETRKRLNEACVELTKAIAIGDLAGRFEGPGAEDAAHLEQARCALGTAMVCADRAVAWLHEGTMVLSLVERLKATGGPPASTKK